MDGGCLLPHFAAVCPALPVASESITGSSMRLLAIKSEKGRFVEVRLTFRLDADSRHQGRFV